jgi:growth factor-regulated tyrosine kinase substrate
VSKLSIFFYISKSNQFSQVKDARAALDALREEEKERRRREAEEAERIRQIQVMWQNRLWQKIAKFL